MPKEKLGSGWDRESDGKKRISVSLDLGMVGALSCAVFENTKRDAARNQPTHNLVYSPEKGQTKYVGSFWQKTGKKGQEYLMGRISLKEIGTVVIGGVTVDFSKHDAPVDAKICRAAKDGGKGPDHHVFRVAAPTKETGGEEE